jgi:transposase
LEAPIRELDAEINRRSKADPVAQRLMTIPGVGPITATAITALVPAPGSFRTGRDFAAWLGLTPLQKSTGGKQTRRRIEARRADHSPVADPRGQRGGSTGLRRGPPARSSASASLANMS